MFPHRSRSLGPHDGGPVPVLFVAEHARLGGTTRYLETLFDHLDRSWIEHVVCLQDGPFVARLRERGLTVSIVPTSGARAFPQAAVALRRIISRSQAWVLHANGIKAATVATMATPGAGMPVLWVKHDHWRDGWLANLVGARCTQIVGVSADVTKTFGRRFASKISVVPSGLTPFKGARTEQRKRLLELLGRSSSGPILTVVGRLDPTKGHRELLEIAPAILERFAGAQFVLIGGEDAPFPEVPRTLQERIATLGLQGSATLLGHRDDAADLVAGCDLVVVPSLIEEGFGLVGLEAMAAGTPVVGYASGALPEVLGECAPLVPPGDRTALLEAIVSVLGDRALADRLERCGRERVGTQFSVDAMVSSMLSRYRDTARSARRGGRRTP